MKEEHKKFVFFIDKQKFETSESQLTVRQVLVDFAKVNQNENVLVLVHANQPMQEFDDLEQMIEIHEGMKFTIFSKKPTPVS
jgi:predicted AAA+ superfamily ATPase